MKVDEFIGEVNFELRNRLSLQFPDQELFLYLKRGHEIVHNLLVQFKSDLVREKGDLSTVVGQSEYAYAEIGMPDISIVESVRMVGEPGMERLSSGDFESLSIDLERESLYLAIPTQFYPERDSLHLFYPPDTAAVVKIGYYPWLSPLTASFTQAGKFSGETPDMPYRDALNSVMAGMIKMLAKNRNADGSQLDPALMEIAQEQVLRILDEREPMDAVMDFSAAQEYWG